ncbi:RNA polymerase sigma factor [Chitinophaga lutea]
MQKIPHTDKELLRRVSSGDADAYRTVFERHWDAVYSTALMLSKSAAIAEDVAQDVFTLLWEKRASLPGVERLEGFLFITARNLIFSRLRRMASQDAYRQYVKARFAPEAAGADEQTEARELEQVIMRAIGQLPPQQQKAFRLSRFEGLAHEEIARAMGVSRVTIKSYIVQAIASLRKVMAKYPSEVMLLIWFFS